MKRVLLLWAAVAIILAALIYAPRAHAALLAPKGTCHHAQDSVASHRAKRHALRCLVAYARAHAGRHTLAGSHRLHNAAVNKGKAIQRCGLSHNACGIPLGTWDRRAGYCASGSSWRVGENLARGYSTPRSVMRAWLRSPPHRANILGSWSSIGTAIRGGVWIVHLGACGG